MSAINWKPTWQQMRAAIRWSKANYKHIGDYPDVRRGAESYIQDLYIEQLEIDARKYHWIMTHMPNPVIDTINDALYKVDDDPN